MSTRKNTTKEEAGQTSPYDEKRENFEKCKEM